MQTSLLTWSTIGRQPLFFTESARRAALHALAAVAGGFILLFAIVDDHIHLVIQVDPKKFGILTRSLTTVLRSRVDAQLSSVFVRAVETRNHLVNLVAYCLTQPAHHRLPWDASTTTGSCFPDMIGARRIPGLTVRIGSALPRFQLRDAYAAVEFPLVPLEPADDATIHMMGAVRLAELTAEAFGADPVLATNHHSSVLARRVFAVLAENCGFRPYDIARALSITPTAAARLTHRSVAPGDTRTVRMRVALEIAAAARALPTAVREPEAPSYNVQNQEIAAA